MTIKRKLHTLYVKHDGQFKTLSKIALSQIILKIIHLQKTGSRINSIQADLSNVIIGSVSSKDITEALMLLQKNNKIHQKHGKYYINSKSANELEESNLEIEELHQFVYEKYFSGTKSKSENVKTWFQDTVIKFFETFSFEWFHQVTYRGKHTSNNVPNLKETLTAVLNNAKGIEEEDKEWLKKQFNKFIDSEEDKENLLFWQYGISMFASRLITAQNYADEISVEMFRNSKFILDTNILMILDLDGHELSPALKTLEKVLSELNISPCYFGKTREEYVRAMRWRKTETIRVFNNFDMSVLKVSDCPFIRTALNRGCQTEDDLNVMFDQLIDIPRLFHKSLPIQKLEYSELNEAIEAGESDTDLKAAINQVYYKRTKRDKRDNPITHDAGMIRGIEFLRKTEHSWIITSDSTLKVYAIENTLRDENEIAVGLDVVLGVMAINSGGVNVEASNFAPLFKNIIKQALIPQSTAFELQDLAFILSSDTKVNELESEKVIEVAREVKRMRIVGENEEHVALYLRRVIEGEKVGMVKEVEDARVNVGLAKTRKEEAERERDLAYDEIRDRRQGQLRDEYDTKLLYNRLFMIIIPIVVGVLVYFTIEYGLKDQREWLKYLIGCSVELIFGLLPLIPINKRLVKKHSEYVNDINRVIENEIGELKKRSK